MLRRRARHAGQSFQAYMRDQLIALADRPTKEESLAAIESVLGHAHGDEPSVVSVVDDLAAARR